MNGLSDEDEAPQTFSHKFGAFTKLPNAFKKSVKRERSSTTNDDLRAPHHDKTSSFGSIFKINKTRFQQPFSNRIRSTSSIMSPPSDHAPSIPINNNNSKSSNNKSKSKESKSKQSMHKSSKSLSLKKGKNKKNRKKSGGTNTTPTSYHSNTNTSSPTPPSHHSHHSRRGSLDVIMQQNRALKDEIEVYRESISSISMERDSISEEYSSLKSSVNDLTSTLNLMRIKVRKLKQEKENNKKQSQDLFNKATKQLKSRNAAIDKIKQQYNDLYGQYIEKNNRIKEWEIKYNKLQNTIKSYKNAINNQNNSNEKYKYLINNIKIKDDQINYLSKLIISMYQNALPVLYGNNGKRKRMINDDDDDEDDNDDDDESSEEDEISDIDGINPRQHRNDLTDDDDEEEEDDDDEDEDDDDDVSTTETETEREELIYHQPTQMRHNMNIRVPSAPRGVVNLHNIVTPLTSTEMQRGTSDSDDENIQKILPMDMEQGIGKLNKLKIPKIIINDMNSPNRHRGSIPKSRRSKNKNKNKNKKKNKKKYRNDSHLDDDNNNDEKNNNNLSVSHSQKIGDSNRSISEMSIDENGIDERDDNDLERKLRLNPLKLKPNTHDNTKSAPNPSSTQNDNKQQHKEKRRRRSFCKQNGPLITTEEGNNNNENTTNQNDNNNNNNNNNKNGVIVTPTTSSINNNNKSLKEQLGKIDITSSPSVNNNQRSVAPSPAPPPPMPNLLQTPQQSPRRNGNNGGIVHIHSQSGSEGDNQSSSPISNIQIAFNTPSPNIKGIQYKNNNQRGAINKSQINPDYSRGNEDDDGNESY